MEGTKPKGMSATTKTYLTIIVILVLAILVLYVSRNLSLGAAERRLGDARAEWVEQTREAMVGQAHDMLKLSAIPLSWAVRAEMMRDNLAQIDEYLQRLVKEPHVNRIALVVEGEVQIATDKKLEEQDAADVFPIETLDVDEATVVDDGEGEIHLAVPIVGIDARLGTLILAYSRDAIESRLPVPEPESPASSDVNVSSAA